MTETDHFSGSPNWVLGMFTKWPEAGRVKSRLAVDTSSTWAAEVARAFLLDLLECFCNLPVRRVVVFAPPEAASAFAELVEDRFQLIPQNSGGLGERLAGFLDEQFQDGAERVVLIGADSPTLPLALVEQAFFGLEDADVVLGPATDGGYYLIGCKRLVPELFQGIGWSGSRVLLDTVTRVQTLGLRLVVLPPWYDVDTLADWWLLQGHLAAWQLAGMATGLNHTEQVKPFGNP